MTESNTPFIVSFIFLFSFVMISESTFSNIEFADNAMCGAETPPPALKKYLRYSSINGPLLDSVRIENGELKPSYPTAITDAYNYEGTRKNGSKCAFCPYNQYPDEFAPEWFLLGNIRVLPTPMYGPCFNGLKSAKINCVQNVLFFPPEFAGEYFYPDQNGNLGLSQGEPFPMHIFLTKTSNLLGDGTPKQPTDYGLGKGRVLGNIGTLIVKYAVSGEIDYNTTFKLQEPFLNDKDGNERWLFWAQYYCTPGCHKNSQQRYVTVRPEDYQNKSQTLYYLSRKTSAVNGALSMYQCKECPPYHASYMWYFDSGNNYEFPGLAKRNPFASQCYPWFGSIPTLILSAQDPAFNTSITQHNIATDGVQIPTQTTYVVSQPCPSGTFNDVCAHTIKYYAGSSPALAQCQPCAAGYHTDGKDGSWYCLPPPGMMMSNWAMLMKISNSKNQSLIWSRRDILGYEFECGYTSSHCTQCSAATNTLGLLPDAFNREMILKPLLAVALCPSTYFCPSPIQAPIKCPDSFPWSPAGSWSISNCTCSRGKYLLAGSCVPCNSNGACPTGFYMAGWRMCTQRDGATNGGICTPCANKPSNANYSSGAGIEVGILSAYSGVCPFKCPFGHQMITSSGGSTCFDTYSCTPIGTLINTGGMAVYSTTLTSKQDEFTAGMSESGVLSCAYNKIFTIEAYNALSATANWPIIATSCASANPLQCATTACGVLEDASYDHNVRCAPCPPAPINGSYSSSANGGFTNLASRSSMCSIQCSSGLYINMTSYTCMSCLALDAAVCPSAEYKIRGQGCLGIYEPFSASNLSSNCIRCSISLADIGSGFYMDLQGTNGCEKKPCPVVNLGSTKYRREVCGGFSVGRVEYCTTLSECGPNQFLSGSCTELTSGICKNCTNYNPGYYIPASGTCSHIATDTLWSLCGTNMGSGFYCPGNGESVVCPNGKTSMPGAKSTSDCYCPAGTRNDGEGGCYNYRCLDSQSSFFVPGVGYTTKSYMALNSAMETACYPCSSLPGNSYSFTTGGVGFESCMCPTEMYGIVVEGGNLSCINCPSTTPTSCSSGGSGYNIPSVCWRGTSIGGPAICQCALPPFTVKSPIGCQIQQCMVNFEPLDVGASVVPLKETSSGSAIYIDRATSLGGWNARYFALDSTSRDYTIAKMIVTSDNTESSSLNNLQFVLWTIKAQDYRNTIWTAPLPPMGRDASYNPYSTNPSPWNFECVSSETRILEDIAISKWPYTYSTEQYFGKTILPPRALVAAVVRQDQQRFLYLKELTINSDTQDVVWSGPDSSNDCGIGLRLPISFEVPANSTVISTTHAYAFPSLAFSVSSSAFYMGYNAPGSCGVVAVRVAADSLQRLESLTLDLTSVSKRQITAMAVLAAPSNGVWLYLAFHNVADSLKLVKWSVNSAGATIIESDEIFKSGWPKVVSVSVLWPKDSILPIFMALVKNDTTGKTAVITADGIQRTFTEVQGMPMSTSPSIVRGLEVGLNKGLIVATGDSTIFTISMQRCPQVSVNSRIVPRFWDGESCKSHLCMRPRTCAIDGVGQVYDNNEMKCVCSPGYYKTSVGPSTLTCVICSSNSYCANNTIFSCPTSMISSSGSKLAVDCTCQEGYYYTGTVCLQCPNGKWCPNKWNAFSCLGGFETVSTQVGSIYPTLCTCSVGFIGPRCDPCSNGKYCSKGAILVSPVTNVPIRLTITLHANIFSTFSIDTIEETACGGVKNALFQLFSSSGIWYLRQLDTLERRFLCKYIPPSPRSKSMLIIVLQIENGDSSSLSYMVNSLTYNTTLITSMMDVNLVEPFQIATYTVINNTENVCPVGKVPTEDRGSCYCAPGYRSSYQLCVGCLSGYYKKLAGPGECIPCPSGTTSKSLSSTCYSTSSTPANFTSVDSSGGDGNLPIIVGGVVGGVVLTALLIFGLVRALYPPKTTTTTGQPPNDKNAECQREVAVKSKSRQVMAMILGLYPSLFKDPILEEHPAILSRVLMYWIAAMSLTRLMAVCWTCAPTLITVAIMYALEALAIEYEGFTFQTAKSEYARKVSLFSFGIISKQKNILMILYNNKMLFGMFFVVMMLDFTESQVPVSYDSRSLWKHCSGFSIVLNQGYCSSCCAMAISSSLSSRECMRDGRDVAYSAQQIWDCAGPSALATCSNGSLLDLMILSLGRGARSSQSLIKGNCSLYAERDTNASKCKIASDGCSADADGPSQIEGSVFYDLLWYSGNAEFGAWAASKAMMSEIWANGPVVAVISLNEQEYSLFGQNSYLKNKKVFVPMPLNDTLSTRFIRHCLTVYGWGQDEVTGLNYWLVQNSWGEEWGDGGTARIVRGMNFLEVEWRGISTSPRPCIKGDKCFNSTFRRLLNPNNNNVSEVNPNIKQMSYHIYVSTASYVTTYAGQLSNIEIFCITMGSSLCIAVLVCIFVVPSSSFSFPVSAYNVNNEDDKNKSFSSHHQPSFFYQNLTTIDPRLAFGPNIYFPGNKWK